MWQTYAKNGFFYGISQNFYTPLQKFIILAYFGVLLNLIHSTLKLYHFLVMRYVISISELYFSIIITLLVYRVE